MPAEVARSAEAEGARHLVEHCSGLSGGEHALVICDPTTRSAAEPVFAAAAAVGAPTELLETPPLRVHGQEPPPEVAAAMARADVVFALTAMSMAHTKARQRAGDGGTRFLSLPDYSLAVLGGRALLTDFRALGEPARRLAGVLTGGSDVRVTTAVGTDLHLHVQGRSGNAASGVCEDPGSLASPPDAEANVAVIEDRSHGVIVVDGSIPCPELGLLEDPITLQVADGRVTEIMGGQAAVLEAVLDQPGDPASRVVAELGIGLNPLARLTGSMLEDEGTLGTVHIGIGANSALGGRNHVPFHLDHVLRGPTVTIDGRIILRDGVIEDEE